ncbi:MAG: oligosaccharide flippase family protein, partial [Candidatus Eisenbacteria bacterium]|nr:oligosaccharide flippase family protein [Candidatus Eisenbacteria bacterium]
GRPGAGQAGGRTVHSEAAATLAYNVVALFAGAVTNVIVARALGPTGKGILSLINYAVFVAAQIGLLGMPAASIQLIGKGRHGKGEVAAAVTIVALAAGVVCGLAVWLLLPRYAGTIPLTSGMVAAAAILVLPSLLRGDLSGIFMALGRIRAYNLAYALPTIVWTAVAFVLLVPMHGTVEQAVLAWAALQALGGLGTLAWAFRMAPPRFRLEELGPTIRAAFAFGLPAWAATLIWVLVMRIEGFVLAAYRDAAEVGLYSVAVLIAEVLLNVPRAMNVSLNRRFAAGEGESVGRLARRASGNGVVLVLIGAVAAAALAPFVVPLLFGSDFRGSVGPLWVLLPGTVILAFATPLSLYLLQQKGKPAWTGAASFAGLVANVAFCFLWIPRYGALGAAAASTAGYAGHAILIAILFQRSTGVAWSRMVMVERQDVRLWLDTALKFLRIGRGR